MVRHGVGWRSYVISLASASPINSVILQVCGADHLAVLVDFGCLTALMLQIASRCSSFSGLA